MKQLADSLMIDDTPEGLRIQLVDKDGHPVKEVSPVEVDLKRGERLRQLALTLIVNLQGE